MWQMRPRWGQDRPKCRVFFFAFSRHNFPLLAEEEGRTRRRFWPIQFLAYSFLASPFLFVVVGVGVVVLLVLVRVSVLLSVVCVLLVVFFSQ